MYTSAILLALGLNVASVAAKSVFAHFIVGTTSQYVQQDWFNAVSNASAAGIDGFALDIGTDSYTDTQLTNAFNAADQYGNGFTMFISFDYGAADFTADEVISTLQSYIGRSSYFQYNNQPLASTFEGPGSAGDWTQIKAATDVFFMPDYSSLGPQAAANTENVDGLLSWDAWPTGNTDTPTMDSAYVSALNGKPYMMPVSPWFYTNLPEYSKNWLWQGNDLWHDRWQQVYQINPELVEILTWNDWGESSYIGPNPPYQGAIPTGAAPYVNSVVHDAWLNDLPYYISQYKNGSPPTNYTEHITFWYRLNPGSACSDGGTTCNDGAYQSTLPPGTCDTDEVMFTVFSNDAPTVTISIGGATQTVTATSGGAFHSSVPFNGNTGNVTIQATVGGNTLGPVTGPPISTDCSGYSNQVNWNTWVGGS